MLISLISNGNTNFEKNYSKGLSCFSAGEMAWKQEYQDNQLKIESATIQYVDPKTGMNQERIVFRYTNLGGKKLKVTFGRKMMYNGVCYGCEKTDKSYEVELNPNESKEYSEQNRSKTFYIFSKDNKGTITKTLDGFEITNLQITAL